MRVDEGELICGPTITLVDDDDATYHPNDLKATIASLSPYQREELAAGMWDKNRPVEEEPDFVSDFEKLFEDAREFTQNRDSGSPVPPIVRQFQCSARTAPNAPPPAMTYLDIIEDHFMENLYEAA